MNMVIHTAHKTLTTMVKTWGLRLPVKMEKRSQAE